MADHGAVSLVGRDAEIDLLYEFVTRAGRQGEALLLSGEPGVGKTVLLNAAAAIAEAEGSLVLRAGGVEFEADLPYSALHQALMPLTDFAGLPPAQRDAIAVACGIGQGPPPARMLVSAAALALLVREANRHPVLLVVDDLPWIDRASASVFAFVARRLHGNRIGFLASCRSESEDLFDRSGLVSYTIEPLAPAPARDLLDAQLPALGARLRSRILAEAQGNPLALLELPSTLAMPGTSLALTAQRVLPLSARLRRHFSSQLDRVPVRTRDLLLMLALNPTGDLMALAGRSSDPIVDLEPAARVGLVVIDPVRFTCDIRHPLIRSAIVGIALTADRRKAHTALAEASADPDRRAWHLAEASCGPNESVALQLEAAAHRILAKGDTVGGVTALMRAGSLSPDARDRSRRIAEAAYIGAKINGNLSDVSELLTEARSADPDTRDSLETAVAAAYAVLDGDGDIVTAHRLLVGAIEVSERRFDPEDPFLVEALHVLFQVCLWAERGDLFPPFDAVVADLGQAVPESLWFQNVVLRDPARVSTSALGRLDQAIAGLDLETDVVRIERIVRASTYVDRVSACRGALERVVEDGRRGGAIATAISALMQVCVDDYFIGEWDPARQLADEGVRLCRIHGFNLPRWCFELGDALVAAGRGERERVRTVTDAMLNWAVPRGVGGVVGFAQHALAMDALANGDWEGAFQRAARISAPGVLQPRVGSSLWVALALVEGAVLSDHRREAEDHVAEMRRDRRREDLATDGHGGRGRGGNDHRRARRIRPLRESAADPRSRSLDVRDGANPAGLRSTTPPRTFGHAGPGPTRTRG